MSEPLESTLWCVSRALSPRVSHPGAGLFEAAEAERVAPLLYYGHVHHGIPERLPDAERESFRRAYYRSAGLNVELLGGLSDVAAVLAQNGVASIAVKGADLAKRIYPNLALRPMGDVDLYVAPQDAERAERVLASAGYRPWTPDMRPGLSRRIRHARLYVGGARESIGVDLHWSLVGHAEDVRAPEREWIDRHTRRSGEPWQRLSETAHLLYLAAHMKLQHYDEALPLSWLVDFHRLAASGAIDWDELFADAARFGWTGAVASCAFDVRERLGAMLPPALERIAAAPARALHARGARTAPERIVNELRTLPWTGRAALVKAYLLPSPSYVRFRYPPPRGLPAWSWPIGYLRRWWRIAVKGCALAARAIRGGDHPRPLLAPRETC